MSGSMFEWDLHGDEPEPPERPVVRFLVVYDSPSGMAQLNNVGVFDAEDEADAQLKACDAFSCDRRYAREVMKVERLDKLPDGWSYYT